MGAHEFARQYEWSTWKSQPNCLKRNGSEDSGSDGLTAVDFRAGLALLPFLPMSPGDFKLIVTGLARGSLVQFDRGDITKLKAVCRGAQRRICRYGRHADRVGKRGGSIPQLHSGYYPQSYSSALQPETVGDHAEKCRSPAGGSEILSTTKRRQKLQNSPVSTLLFAMLGLIPFIGRFVRRIWGQPFWRTHYRKMLTSRIIFSERCVQNSSKKSLAGTEPAG